MLKAMNRILYIFASWLYSLPTNIVNNALQIYWIFDQWKKTLKDCLATSGGHIVAVSEVRGSQNNQQWIRSHDMVDITVWIRS